MSVPPSISDPDQGHPNQQKATWPARSAIEGSFKTANLIEFDAATSSVQLVRQISLGDKVVIRTVVWLQIMDEERATDMLEALAARSRWSALWASGAILLGQDWFASTAASLTASYVDERARRHEKERLEREQAEENARVAADAGKKINAYFRMTGGRFSVDLERGDAAKPFWQISFDHKWERERFWDWMRNQNARFEEVRSLAAQGLGREVERLFLQEMLATERAVKKQGLGAGGRRPLRFWRGEAR